MIKTPCPGLLRKSLPAVFAPACLLNLLIGFVGASSSKKIQKVIIRQFNEQKLFPAGRASNQIQTQTSSSDRKESDITK
jgi:hypothetical protein